MSDDKKTLPVGRCIHYCVSKAQWFYEDPTPIPKLTLEQADEDFIYYQELAEKKRSKSQKEDCTEKGGETECPPKKK